jgi:hypothetical protein
LDAIGFGKTGKGTFFSLCYCLGLLMILGQMPLLSHKTFPLSHKRLAKKALSAIPALMFLGNSQNVNESKHNLQKEHKNKPLSHAENSSVVSKV